MVGKLLESKKKCGVTRKKKEREESKGIESSIFALFSCDWFVS
jgi:hypothetical protein